MADDAVVFALANPVPEIMPELMPDNVAVVATGRSDYPNQIKCARVLPASSADCLTFEHECLDVCEAPLQKRSLPW